MLNLKKVAVTGGLSCGKSSVCRLFKELGAYVVSADEIVHQLLSPETPIGQQVIQLIGFDIIVDQRIDRTAIAKKVFGHPTLLQSLENILHPAVRNAIENEYQRLKSNGKQGLFVAEIPLLFESQNPMTFDVTIAVIAPESLCRARFKASKGSDSDFKSRMERQLRPEEKARRADFVIHNDGSWENLQQSVKSIYEQLTS